MRTGELEAEGGSGEQMVAMASGGWRWRAECLAEDSGVRGQGRGSLSFVATRNKPIVDTAEK